MKHKRSSTKCYTAERYRSSQQFREQHKETMRQQYRKKRAGGVEPRTVPDVDPESLGTVRELVGVGAGRRHCTFTAAETAEVLGCGSTSVVARWFSGPQLPTRTYRALLEYTGRGGAARTTVVYVYLLEEIVTLRRVLADHFAHTSYYREDHVQTIERMCAEIEHTRGQINAQYSQTT